MTGLPTPEAEARETAAAPRRGSVLSLASTTYATTLLGLITAPIVARALGPAGRGAYAAVMSYSTLVTTVLGLGISLTVTRMVLARRRDPAAVLGAVLRFCLAILPAAVVAGVLIAVFVLDDYDRATRVGVVVFSGLAPLAILQLCLISLLLSSGGLGSLAIVRAAPFVVNAVGVVVLALAGLLTLTSYLAITALGAILALCVSVREVGLRPRRGVRTRSMLGFGLRAYPASLGNLANAQLNQLLIAPLLGAADLGYYAVAVVIANVPLGLVAAIGARATAQMTDEHGRLAKASVAERLRLSVVVGGLGSLLLAPVVPVLVPIVFGSAFDPTIDLCLVLLTASVAQAISTVAGSALILAERPGTTSAAQGVGLAVSAVGLAIALPLLGVLGAAIVASVAFWACALVQLWALRRLGVRDLRPRAGDVEALARRARSSARVALRRLPGRRG